MNFYRNMYQLVFSLITSTNSRGCGSDWTLEFFESGSAYVFLSWGWIHFFLLKRIQSDLIKLCFLLISKKYVKNIKIMKWWVESNPGSSFFRGSGRIRTRLFLMVGFRSAEKPTRSSVYLYILKGQNFIFSSLS